MRYALLLLLPVLFVNLSCKKPHYGYWSALFRFENGEVWSWPARFHLEKREHSFLFVSDDYNDPHGSEGGEITFDEKTITGGTITGRYSFSGMGYDRIFSDFKGTFDRETASGTFYYRRYLFNYGSPHPDTTLTGTGTFELRWLYQKEPKKK